MYEGQGKRAQLYRERAQERVEKLVQEIGAGGASDPCSEKNQMNAPSERAGPIQAVKSW